MMMMLMKLTIHTKTQGVDCSIFFVVVYKDNLFPENRYARYRVIFLTGTPLKS